MGCGKSVICCVPMLSHMRLAGMKNFLKPTGNQKQVAVMLRNELERLRKWQDWVTYSRLKQKAEHLWWLQILHQFVRITT